VQWAPRIRGTYLRYEDRWAHPLVIVLEEERTVHFFGWQVMAGVAF